MIQFTNCKSSLSKTKFRTFEFKFDSYDKEKERKRD
jgi:hypothetical protein